MSRRIAELRREMEREGLDAVIATSYAAFYYLTGAPLFEFGRPAAAVIPLEGEAALVTSIIEEPHLDAQTWIEDRRHYWDYNMGPVFENPQPPLASLVHHLAAVLADRGLATGRLGIEELKLPLAHYDALRGALPKAAFVGASVLLDGLRMILSGEELALLRASDAVADIGYEALSTNIAPGISAFDLEAATRGAMIDAVTRHHPDKPFSVFCKVGLGSPAKGAGHADWHVWNRDDRVETGLLMKANLDVSLWGYFGSLVRTFYVGPIPEAVRRPFEAMVEANRVGIAAIKPGARLADVDRVCKDVLGRRGYSTRSGSGLGRGIISHEGNARELRMDVRLYNDAVFQPGMAIELVPDLLVPDVGMFLHATTIIITEHGCEVDSRIPIDVISV